MTRPIFALFSLAALAAGCSPTPAARCSEPARAGAVESTAADGSQTTASPVSVERVRHEVDADGHPIAVWEKSPATPRGVLVLVHGRTWSGVPDFDLQVEGESLSLMDDLVARGFATYAVDLRGYGGTPRDATQWLTPDRAAADLAVVLAWVGSRHQLDRPPALLGWSYGSMVSQLTAQQHPELVSDLVLYGYPRDPDREYLPREAPPEPPKQENTAEAAASDFITPDSISDAAKEAYVEQSLAADPVRVDWKDEHEWSALDPAAVKVPTLVLHGEHDPYAPVANQARLFERLGHPDRRWVIVAGGDHAAHLERPRDRFLEALVEFLERPRAP